MRRDPLPVGRPIALGDLVAVVRDTTCCPCVRADMGRVFTVGWLGIDGLTQVPVALHRMNEPCPTCGGIRGYAQADLQVIRGLPEVARIVGHEAAKSREHA